MAAEPGNPQEQPETHRTVSWKSPEIVGELVLLMLMALLMIAFIISLYRPPFLQDDLPKILLPGRWLPTVVIVVATPLWFIRLYTVLSRRKAIEQGMIMDLGFRLGEDPAGEKRRAALYFGSLVALVLLLWFIGFHIGLPLWVMAYLLFWTRAKWYWALLAGLGFEAFIIGILDLTLDIFWFEPLFFRWIGVLYPFSDMFTRIF